MTLNKQLNEVAVMASVVLALLTLFTGLRAGRYAEDLKAGLGRLDRAKLIQLLFDIGLTVIMLIACAAMWSLFSESVSISKWTDRTHALRSLFVVMYIGFVLLLAFQLSIASRRAEKHWSNRAARQETNS
jgi:hypothetical protein